MVGPMVVGDIGSIELEGSPQSAGQQRQTAQSTPTPKCIQGTELYMGQIRMAVLLRAHWKRGRVNRCVGGQPELWDPRKQGLMALGKLRWYLQEVGEEAWVIRWWWWWGRRRWRQRLL